MTMWLVRAGKAGERESLVLENRMAVVGWEQLPDLSGCTTRAVLEMMLRDTYPDEKPRTLHSWHSQIWAIRDTMKTGDLVVLPLKSRPMIAIGTVAGNYRYRDDLSGGPVHTRPVDWLTQVPRRVFDLDILLSFGAFMTVCRIERNGAEQRVRALLDADVVKASDPALNAGAPYAPPVKYTTPSRMACPSACAGVAPPNLEARSHDLIRERIAQKFKGHHLADLVGVILEAQGFKARVSPPGADGGVDIMAGSGPLGFDAPRMIVQVKSQDTKVDVRTLRELAGVMGRFQADHGLLVGWGGFNHSVRAEAAADYFRIRLWDAGDVIASVKEYYPRLPLDIRNEIPLKQVWTLDPAERAGVAA